jgi:hypothetical protein
MKEYNTESLRNVALISRGSGKTMLAEAMLFVSGTTTRGEDRVTAPLCRLLTTRGDPTQISLDQSCLSGA